MKQRTESSPPAPDARSAPQESERAVSQARMRTTCDRLVSKNGFSEKAVVYALAGVMAIAMGKKAEATPMVYQFDKATNGVEILQGENRVVITNDLERLAHEADTQAPRGMLSRIDRLDYTPSGVNPAIKNPQAFKTDILLQAEESGKKLGISLKSSVAMDVQQLTLLSSQVTCDRMQYDYRMIKKDPTYSRLHEQEINAKPLDEVFREGYGVCRQFSVVEREVFRRLLVAYRPDLEKKISFGSVGSLSDLHAWNFVAQNVQDGNGGVYTQLLFIDTVQADGHGGLTSSALVAGNNTHQNIGITAGEFSYSSGLTSGERLDFTRSALELSGKEVQPLLCASLARSYFELSREIPLTELDAFAKRASQELSAARERLEKDTEYRTRHSGGGRKEPARLDFYMMAKMTFETLAERAESFEQKMRVSKEGFRVLPEFSAAIAREYEHAGRTGEAKEWYEHFLEKGPDLYLDVKRVRLADFADAYRFMKKGEWNKEAQRAKKIIEIASNSNDAKDKFPAVEILAGIYQAEGASDRARAVILEAYEEIVFFSKDGDVPEIIEHFGLRAANTLNNAGFSADAQSLRDKIFTFIKIARKE